MTLAGWVVGLMAAGAVLAVLPPRPQPPRRPTPPRRSRPGEGGSRGWTAPAVAAGSALAAALLVGGSLTLPVAVLAGAAAWVAVGRSEPAAVRRRRERLETDLPHAVDLLAACLVGGQAPGHALGHVAAALRGPVADELAVAASRLRLGVDPVTVWRDVARHPQLGVLGRAVVRATDSGASVAEAMTRLAEDLRRESRARVESRARSVGVKAALPLGVCLLPAFVLTGVVPLVAGAVRTVVAP